ncbi:MAG: glycosyltransferase family 39 protein, partial [Planctomycetes bacterium]|nr:glycosyltransferase family 39 protein [Planctomycetota bacterium]
RAFYPLTFLALRLAIDMQWLSSGEGAIRLPFALFGIATVPALWFVGRRLIGDGAALFAAALLAVMPWHVYWSQNARGYVFVVLSSVAVAAAAWRWHETGRRRDLALVAAAIALGTLFHLTALMQLLGLAAFFALRRHELGSRALLGCILGAAIVLAVLPIAMVYLPPLQGFLGAKSEGASWSHFPITAGYFFRPLLLLTAIAGFFLLRRRLGRERALLLACLAATPFLVLTVVGGTTAKSTARYAICALPALVWLGAFAAFELAGLLRGTFGQAPGRRLVANGAAAFVGLALLADFGVGTWHYFADHHGDRARWPEACRFVERRFGAGRLHVLTTGEPIVRYYLTRDYWQNGSLSDPARQIRIFAHWLYDGRLADGTKIHEPGAAAHLQWQVEQARANSAQLVVALTLPELAEYDADGSLWRALRAEFELALYLPCWVGPKDQSIYVFLPKG